MAESPKAKVKMIKEITASSVQIFFFGYFISFAHDFGEINHFNLLIFELKFSLLLLKFCGFTGSSFKKAAEKVSCLFSVEMFGWHIANWSLS